MPAYVVFPPGFVGINGVKLDIVCEEINLRDPIASNRSLSVKLVLGLKRLKWAEFFTVLDGYNPDLPKPDLCLLRQERRSKSCILLLPKSSTYYLLNTILLSLSYIMPPKPTLPIDVFPAWARFNDVDFINAKLCETDRKGIGLVTVTGSDLTKIPVTEGEANDKDLQHGKAEALLRIPHDLVLSASTVEDYAKVDQNFRQLMDSVGHNVRLRPSALAFQTNKIHRPV